MRWVTLCALVVPTSVFSQLMYTMSRTLVGSCSPVKSNRMLDKGLKRSKKKEMKNKGQERAPDPPIRPRVPPSLLVKTQAESMQLVYQGGSSDEGDTISTTSSRRRAGSVSFTGVVVVYNHSTRVGDHLDCDGPPVALGEPTDREEFRNLEDYETNRPYKLRDDPRMDPVERLEILQNQGYSIRNIMDVLEEAEKEYMGHSRRSGRFSKILCKE